MTTKIGVRKIRQASDSPQDSSKEIMERWKQLQFVLKRSRQHPEKAGKDVNARSQANLAKAVRFISSIGGLVTLLLAARIGVKLITVNPGTPFGHFVVDLTNLFLRPFSSMTETFSAPHVSMLELGSLTAVILYPFAAWGLIRLLHQLFPLHAR